jgi:mono/diheme cytochrome c family protein
MPHRFVPFALVVVLVWALVCAGIVDAAEPVKPAAVDYLRDVQPILTKHCVACHGPKKAESDLRLDSGAALKVGGYSGSPVVAHKSAESILIQVVTGKGDLSAMPPKGDKLSAAEVAVLARWIDAGAPLPPAITDAPNSAAAKPDVDPKKADHWAYKPIRVTAPPVVKNATWVRNPIDGYILAKLEAAGLAPSPEADKAVLIRRLSLDLIGLPPSPAEVDEFLFDNKPGAYERLVDRLLASPHFGERWGRHWLDAARYADSNGYTIDSGRSIWKYRDWVIDALNADMPFDRFTIEQIAGDMLPGATLEQEIATGFHRNTLVNEEGGTDKEQFRVEAVVDRVSTVGTVWLGLTVACARCHDHKYDAISQREFYQLFALLNNCAEPSLTFPTEHQSKEEPALLAEIAQVKKRLAEVEKNSPGRQLGWEKIVREELRKLEKSEDYPETVDVLADFIAALDTPIEKRTEVQKTLLAEKFRKNDVEKVNLDGQLADLNAKLKQLKAKITTTLIVREMKTPRESYIHIRGDFLRKGAVVEPGTLAVLPAMKTAEGKPATRLDLARWLVSRDNPLTPRVTMNRVWQQLFGQGIVGTENDFGTQGDAPTHPELLDYLAQSFVQGAGGSGREAGNAKPWSLKAMLREIVTSATYRQASHARADLAAKDPYNKLLGRQARIRLEAETIRDSALAASGLLTREVGGPGVYPPQPEGIYAFTQQRKFWPATEGADRYRRGMYTYFWRSSPYPFLMTFDAPDANAACTRRIRSNTPLQALTLANDRSFVEMAQALGDRVLKEKHSTDADRVAAAFRLALVREPQARETATLVKFLQAQRAAAKAEPLAAAGSEPGRLATVDAERVAWTAVARVLLNLDEFITRE